MYYFSYYRMDNLNDERFYKGDFDWSDNIEEVKYFKCLKKVVEELKARGYFVNVFDSNKNFLFSRTREGIINKKRKLKNAKDYI